MKKLLCTTAIMAAFATPAFASETDVLRQQIDLMKQQLAAMEQKLDAQETVIQGQHEKLAATQEAVENQAQRQASVIANTMAAIKPSAGEANASPVKITMKPSPKIESVDGAYSFQPFGRVHFDTTFFDDGVADHPNGSEFRRARLGAKGKVAQDWGYKFEVDFADENVSAKDIYLSYDGVKGLSVKAGNMKPRQSLEQQTSSNVILQTERASPVGAFTQSQVLGFNADTHWDNGSFAVGVFHDDVGTNSADDEAQSITSRLAYAPINDDRKTLHLGVSGSYRKPDRSTDTFTFRSKAENGQQSLQSVSATVNNADNAVVTGLELGAAFGPALLQAEYLRTDVSRDSGSPDAEFDGWYAQGSYTLTGENRAYNVKKGSFGRITPNNPLSPSDGNWGAFEVTGRYSDLDLNDAGAGVLGGEMKNITLGLNWYPTKHVRFLANYVNVDTDANAVTPHDDPQIFILRSQIDF